MTTLLKNSKDIRHLARTRQGRRACTIQLREQVLPRISTHVPETEGENQSKLLKQTRTMEFSILVKRLLPFNIGHPSGEALPGLLHTGENVLQECDPDGLQDGVNGVPEKILLNAVQAR